MNRILVFLISLIVLGAAFAAVATAQENRRPTKSATVSSSPADNETEDDDNETDDDARPSRGPRKPTEAPGGERVPGRLAADNGTVAGRYVSFRVDAAGCAILDY